MAALLVTPPPSIQKKKHNKNKTKNPKPKKPQTVSEYILIQLYMSSVVINTRTAEAEWLKE